MSKSKPLFSSNLRKHVNELNSDIFIIDGKVLYYQVCDVKVSTEKTFTTQKHITSDEHILSI